MKQMHTIYLDHAATTPMANEVIHVMTEAMKQNFGNPSSTHHLGRKAQFSLLQARDCVAKSIHAKPHEIIFTSGGTEGDNTAILQSALKKQHEGKHIITTAIEHPAVLKPMQYLEHLGFDVTYLPVDQNGMITVQQVKQALREDTILVSLMLVNNETGNILPIAKVGEVLKHHSALFHTDAVQGFGPLPVDVNQLGVDLLSVSAHKFNGPKGIGFLYQKEGTGLLPYLKGGSQEEKRRAGTENIPAILGMAKACQLLTEKEKINRQEQMKTWHHYILKRLEKEKIHFQLNGDETHKVFHILNLYFPNIKNELLLMKLDLKGIALSAGSACTAGSIEPSHVLEAMYGKNSTIPTESLRISLGYENTKEEIDIFLDELIQEVRKYQEK